MKSLGIALLGILSVSCGDEATSKQNSSPSSLGPPSESFVISDRYPFDENLKRRLSLIMPLGTVELYALEGTHSLDTLGLAVKGKTFKKNGYEHILAPDFKALRTREAESGARPKLDLLEYDTGRKIGALIFSAIRGGYVLSELCTGSAEATCEFRYVEDDLSFTFKFLPQIEE